MPLQGDEKFEFIIYNIIIIITLIYVYRPIELCTITEYFITLYTHFLIFNNLPIFPHFSAMFSDNIHSNNEDE